ncbi:DgyrCDS4078 [Dimorphilus gyrociliatus]|uniref:DgyrCDS4078 n=1 Tax=Dimorphilus gyrociliatus TaxID=2664684 RepID=A0A7I8VHA2_9ANNE|nr:DgyrCDS4078 [Dimorphilus gyrociliatus]
MPSNNQLDPKENALFKRVLKCYEQKQYKNGLKFAKQILSNPKFSEHGETLAMKGLTLNCLGKKEDAYDYVKKGLKNDLKSHVCWHVYGLLQRSDRKYEEAIKCYRNALKWDKDNLQILRDLSLLQIQMRDLEGYRETRYQLLVLRPIQRASWIGYAMAHHLLKNYEMAFQVLEEFRKTQSDVKPWDYEHSELLLYQNNVLTEAGNLQAALDHLNKYETHILDKLVLFETRASLLLKLEMFEEAENIYLKLIDRNPENKAYYEGVAAARRCETPESKLAIYKEIKEKYPRASVPRRMPLIFASPSQGFKEYADALLRRSLQKGIPPLFVMLKPLYQDAQKVTILEELILQYANNLKSCNKFHHDDDETQNPTVLLWTYHLLAQHFDQIGDTVKALDYINEALNHTVTLIELLVVKAKIFKHAGDVVQAAECMDEAQSLDTADRFINSKCAKYMIRAGWMTKAEVMCAKFTREGMPATESLNEMQCMWYQSECAASYMNQGRYGEALKKCVEIDRHFMQINDDQFDFHTYCMRKMTLRAYIDLLRLEDRLKCHKFYVKTATIAISIYVHLHDHPVADRKQKDDNDSGLSASELKKRKNKERKAAKKAAAEQAAKRAEEAKKEHNKKLPPADPDIDRVPEETLDPEKLERTEKPLDEAIKFLKPLLSLRPNDLNTHILAFEIYFRRSKPLLMLQAIKKGLSIDTCDPVLHTCVIRFLKYVASTKHDNPAVKEVLESEMASLFPNGVDPVVVNNKFLENYPKSLPHLLAAAKMMFLLDTETGERARSLVIGLNSDLTSVNIKSCTEVLKALEGDELGKCEKMYQDYKELCHEKFPFARAFFPPNKLVNGNSEVENEP